MTRPRERRRGARQASKRFGRPLRITPAGSSAVRCAATSPFLGPAAAGDWNGWGNGIENTRFARDGGLTADDLPKLKLKWAFGYADVTSARTQPSVVGNRLFVASDSGDVYALDPKTGCAYWTFRAQASVGMLVASAHARARPRANGAPARAATAAAGRRCSTCSWCRKASTSSWSAARECAHVRSVWTSVTSGLGERRRIPSGSSLGVQLNPSNSLRSAASGKSSADSQRGGLRAGERLTASVS
jgi:hypothetical protein